MLPRKSAVFVTSLFILACSSTVKPRSEAHAAPPPPAKTIAFGWAVGAKVEVVQRSERGGVTVEVSAHGAVEAFDKGQLAIAFDRVSVADKDKKLVKPDASHAFLDVWPTLVVDGKSGEIVGFGSTLPDEAHGVVGMRWRLWTSHVGMDLPLGETRQIEGEVEVGEGLIAPVVVTESREPVADKGVERLTIKRHYEGETTKKLWVMMLSESGAKVDPKGIQEAAQDEVLVIDFEVATGRPRTVDFTSSFTVKALAGKGEKTDTRVERDAWKFVWSK